MQPLKHTSLLFLCFIFILFFAGGFFYSLTLFIPLYDDAGSMPVIGKYHDALLSNIVLYPHGLFNTLPFALGMQVFGVSGESLHLTLVLILFLYLAVLFFFIKKMFDHTTAIVALLLHVFTFFTFFTTFIMESDGIIMSFLTLLTMFPLYFFLGKPSESKPVSSLLTPGFWWLLLSIASFTLLVSMKYRTGLLFFPLLLYIIFITRSIRKTFFYACCYGIGLLFSAVLHFFIFTFVYREQTTQLLHIIFAHSTTKLDLFTKLTSPSLFVPLVISLTPLILCLLLLNIKQVKEHWQDTDALAKYALLYFWLLIAVPYILLVPAGLSLVKYLSGVLLPPLIILSAAALARLSSLLFIDFKKLLLSVVAGTALLSPLLVFLNNYIADDYWFFMTEMGPVVKVWQPLLLGCFLLGFLSFFCFFRSLFVKKEKQRQSFLVLVPQSWLLLFLIISFSFNVLLLTDNLVDNTHQRLLDDVFSYATQHPSLGTIYAWNEDIPFYLGNPGFYIVSETEKNFGAEYDATPILRTYSRSVGMGQQGYIDLSIPRERIREIIQQKPGTVFLLNYPAKYTIQNPYLDFKERINIIDEHCTKKQESIYKTGSLLIYICP